VRQAATPEPLHVLQVSEHLAHLPESE